MIKKILLLFLVISCSYNPPNNEIIKSEDKTQEKIKTIVDEKIEEKKDEKNQVENIEKEPPIIRVKIKSDKKKNYRGKVYKIKNNIINELDIEQYLYGVVGNEISANSPIEAIKAQAIAARTYALKQAMNNNKIYDLYDDTRSQVYKGIKSENENVKKAVDETRGIVILYEGQLIDALYHSCSGHKTKNNEKVFGKKVEYLSSVKDYCSDSKWSYKIKKSIYNKYKNNFKKLRQYVGYTKIKSSNITSIKTKGNYVYLQGVGFGHGVGMSQKGAINLAKMGYDYNYILTHYYKNVQLKKIY